MARKKIDSRILKLLKRSVLLRHRCMFFICGENARSQVMYLHHLLLKCRETTQEKILWCYKKETGLNIHRSQKKLNQLRKKGGEITCKEEAFERFLLATQPHFCHYSETDHVLGMTFSVLVVDDFEAVCPNTLARITECVEGGGTIIILLKHPLTQLPHLHMDGHDRFVTESYPVVTPLFNHRLLLSLTSCPACIATDDNLNVNLYTELENHNPDNQIEDKIIKKNGLEKEGILGVCCTWEQLSALRGLLSLRPPSVGFLSSSRGRGKSAVLGLAISVAIVEGSRVLFTAPHAENVKTLVVFIGKGLEAQGWKEGVDFELHNKNSSPSVVILRNGLHRVGASFLTPILGHRSVLGADLVVMDEAAAIPLPIVKKWIEGSTNAILIMASTLHGYEGTGRSLSLKLLEQLRNPEAGRPLQEIQLSEPIRYADRDPIEAWLYRLLCLEATPTPLLDELPDPKECRLFRLNRKLLFSGNPASDLFLSRLTSLFVTSHYNNSPNDLQMAADAPAHALFCLMGREEEPLVAIQVSLEGGISSQSVHFEQSQGRRAQGDLIPWIISQQFQNKEFPSLRSARIVRIATHPDCQRKGFGERALELLASFYSSEDDNEDEDGVLLNEGGRRKKLDYLGVSFGLTHQLLRFWKRCCFVPLYIRQTPSDVTGEHSCVMVRPLCNSSCDWLESYHSDFLLRFSALLPTSFRDLHSCIVADILRNATPTPQALSACSLLRLEAYCRNEVDFHLILDLVPTLLQMAPPLPTTQLCVIICLGLQGKSVDDSARELGMETQQLLGCFGKAIRKMTHQSKKGLDSR